MYTFYALFLLLPCASLALQLNVWQEGLGQDAAIDLQDTPYADYWESLPALQLSGNNKYLKVDGYSFKGRMSIYHFLINSVDSEELWGETSLREYHWLWAYAAQLDWQHRSRRLHPSGDLDQIISTESWWGYMNFGFSVAILLGWKQTRPDITIELDSISQHLIENDKAMQKCIQRWESFFRDGYTEFIDALDTASDVQEARYRLQHHVWDAHTSVIDYCQHEGTTYSILLDKMPPPERRFGEGWARMVHVLAAACFPTDLVTLKQDGGGFLPLEPLDVETWNHMPSSNHHDACRRRTVLATHDLVSMSPWQRQQMVSFWKRVARSKEISRFLPRVIVDLYHKALWAKLRQVGRLMNWFFRPQEKIAIAAGLSVPLFVKLLR